jgi:hypothetical protein
MTIYIDDNFHKELNMKNPIKRQIDKTRNAWRWIIRKQKRNLSRLLARKDATNWFWVRDGVYHHILNI